MIVRPRRRVQHGLTALAATSALFLGGMALAGAARAAAPSYEPDSNAAGTVALYNASGVQITSGSTTTAPFANYYVGSGGVIAGSPSNAGAQAYAATPRDGVNSQQWGNDTLSASTPLGPAVSANYPGALKNSDKAIAKATSDDFSLADYISEYPAASTANPNVYQIRVLTGNPAKYYTMDVQVSGSTWTQVYPDATPVTDPTTVAIAASPRSVRYGSSTTLTATVTNSSDSSRVTGVPVTLYRKAAGQSAYAVVRTVTTSSTGTASVANVPPSNSLYQWRYAGNAAHKAANSAVASVTVTPVVSIAATPTAVKRGQVTKVYGVATPYTSGETVVLQRLLSGKWTNQISTTIKYQTLPNGRKAFGYAFARTLSVAGTYTFRVTTAATSYSLAGVSGAVTVRAS